MENVWFAQERAFFSQCLCALHKYRTACMQQADFYKKMGLRNEEQIQKLVKAIDQNSDLFEFMSKYGPSVFGEEGLFQSIDVKFDESDLMQLDAALHSAARDWTSIGAKERQEVYSPILESLKNFLPESGNVLVPGSGLCRLAVEIAAAGYCVEANESAFIMLAFSYFAMFGTEKFTIYPFLHQISGLDKFDDCLVNAMFPDLSDSLLGPEVGLDPGQLVTTGKLRLKAGKFEGVYSPYEPKFSAVVTSFFIDVVQDVRVTIARFYSLLVNGGIWINVGPIVNHNPNVGYFAPLTYEDIDIMAKRAGFEIIEQKRIETTYSQNPRSHVMNKYNVAYTVYRK